jgi:hypothetical protein
MAVVVDRVQETSTTLGTAASVLGGAVSGFRTFAAALSTGAVVPYAAFDASGGGWETGLGTFNAGANTLARTTIRASSNAGAAVAWDSGTRQVFISPTAADGIQAMLRTALGGGVAGQPLIARGAGDAAWGGGAAVMTSSFLSGTASLTLDPACIALDIIAGGAGGGGGPGVLCSGYGSGGGAGGGGTIVGPVLVRVADLPSTTLTVIVGAAGAAVAGLTTGGGSTSPSTSGVPGGASSVVSGSRTLISAFGGGGGSSGWQGSRAGGGGGAGLSSAGGTALSDSNGGGGAAGADGGVAGGFNGATPGTNTTPFGGGAGGSHAYQSANSGSVGGNTYGGGAGGGAGGYLNATLAGVAG